MPSRGEMNGSDWETVSFNRPASGKAPGGGGPGPRKPGSAATSSGIAAAKLEGETEELKHAAVGKDLKVALMKARNAKGLSQKELANRLQMDQKTITEYEQGKGIPNNAIIAKIERELGCKLPRPPKK